MTVPYPAPDPAVTARMYAAAGYRPEHTPPVPSGAEAETINTDLEDVFVGGKITVRMRRREALNSLLAYGQWLDKYDDGTTDELVKLGIARRVPLLVLVDEAAAMTWLTNNPRLEAPRKKRIGAVPDQGTAPTEMTC